ncbi:aldose epimerase family protein [Cypionkella sp.]|uniref:aldose epimerase family protein n=1 Tax=Cypionkella sp. TaxID=2811411 RepID=UPI002ABBBF80|nr:aldose epimerase family protein [Cypionkella sp.]MDZ4394978.1 aldose epimerase family protein [Cypionkella sp.]
MAYFGTTAAGETVEKITLSAGDLSVAILSWGAVIQSVRLKGIPHDLTLGSETLAEYEGDLRYHGSIIAPVVNRLTDAQAPLHDQTLNFQVNFNGQHTLHSGDAGTQLKVWNLIHATETECLLALTLPHNEGGFPGTRRITALFQIAAPASLRLTITTTTDADTILNATNHSYWNLDGTADFTGHSLQINADHYLPATPEFIPTGEIRPTTDMFDFRKSKPIGPNTPDLDNCFCLSQAQQPLRDVLTLTGQSGTEMTVATTEPGIQIYDCRHDHYKGLAIEAQGWPDAPNKPGFPAITLRANETLTQITEWRFTKPA